MCVGRTDSLDSPGKFQVSQVGRENLLIVRGRDLRLRAFHNMCRHRGARLCVDTSGALGKTIRCMYHGWMYGLDGRLTSAPNMADMPGMAKDEYGLLPVRLEEWLGYAWVNLDELAPSLGSQVEPQVQARLGDIAKLDRYGLDRLGCAKTIRYDVECNWKIFVENLMECYHCAPLHPQLIAVIPQFATGYGTISSRPGVGVEFAEGAGYSLSGTVRRPRLPGLTPADSQLHAVVIRPNVFLVLAPDHVAVYRLEPVSAGRTTVFVDSLFDPAQLHRTDADLDNTVELRDITVRQDVEACERCQLGMRSAAYQGVLVPAEHAIVDFYRYVYGAVGEPLPDAYREGAG
jgi:Rieske 2Fe-2S family protein